MRTGMRVRSPSTGRGAEVRSIEVCILEVGTVQSSSFTLGCVLRCLLAALSCIEHDMRGLCGYMCTVVHAVGA